MSLRELLKSIYPAVDFFSSLHVHRSRVLSISLRLLLIIFLLGSISFGSYIYIFKDLPSPTNLSSQNLPLTTHIRDRNGQELYKIYGSQNRTLLKLNEIPLLLRQAILSIEDKDFYQHGGFSLTGTIRAAFHTLSNQRLEGGSTITQQLVKTSLLSPDRTLKRKIRELVLSIAVESIYSKDQILEMYLNRVGFGGAAYGVEEGSRTYFGKSVSQLDLAEVALLAGLPASPTTYSPFGTHPDFALARQKEVLNRMVANSYITPEQAAEAAKETLKFIPPSTDIQAPHFVMYVKELLAEKYGTDVVEHGGLDVITSLDLDLQNTVQEVVTDQTAKIAYLHVTNGAALVTNPQTGEILAMVGSRNYFDLKHDGNVNVVIAPRQPGSSIKPINYALALSQGFTAASIIDDSPITYHYPNQPSYSPVNYDGRFHGQVTLRTALANSYNVPAVKLLSANGVANMVSLGQKMGISTWNNSSQFGLSLTLGSGEVTMADMAVVYGTLANLGSRVDLHPILKVKDSRGRELEKFRCPKPEFSFLPEVKAAEPVSALATEITFCPPQEVINPGIAFIISNILSDNVARSATFGLNSDLNIPNQTVAVKTGTTNDLRDNWTIGYTPNILVATWVGNNDNTPMSHIASGVTGASPIWHQIMVSVLKSHPSSGFTPPQNLITATICSQTNQSICGACPTKSEYFLKGTEPHQTVCPPPQAENPPFKDRDRILKGIHTF